MSNNVGLDIYGQIVSAWRFLHVGLFLDKLMKNTHTQIEDGFSFNGYNFVPSAVQASWPNAFVGKSGESYFGSHVFHLSSREIFSGIVEGLNKKTADDDTILMFRTFVKEKLQDQFESYYILIRFCRNVLSHNVTDDLILTENDFGSQKKYLEKNKASLNIGLEVNYCEIFNPKYPHQDHFNISVDFSTVEKGARFSTHITPEQLMQLVIFSGSLAESYINKRTSLYTLYRGVKLG